MEAKFGPSDKRIKRVTPIKTKFFRITAGNTLLTTKLMKEFWKSWTYNQLMRN